MEKLNLKFLQSLATQYPSVAKACTEIINLQAILNLPKETEQKETEEQEIKKAIEIE